MPVYEYECGACGHELEIKQRMADDKLTRCPACEAETLERLISRSSFHLKGGGWFDSAYSKAPKEGDGKKTPEPKSGESKGAATSSDSSSSTSGGSSSGGSAGASSSSGSSSSSSSRSGSSSPGSSSSGSSSSD